VNTHSWSTYRLTGAASSTSETHWLLQGGLTEPDKRRSQTNGPGNSPMARWTLTCDTVAQRLCYARSQYSADDTGQLASCSVLSRDSLFLRFQCIPQIRHGLELVFGTGETKNITPKFASCAPPLESWKPIHSHSRCTATQQHLPRLLI
jgi:hypothetical protein